MAGRAPMDSRTGLLKKQADWRREQAAATAEHRHRDRQRATTDQLRARRAGERDDS